MSDPAHILFPSDVPGAAPQSAPEWFSAQRSGAELRLAGVQDSGSAAEGTPATAKAGEPASPAGPVDKAKPDAAAVWFKNDVADAGAKAVTDILDGFANSAISDGDGGERFRAIEAARDGLLADARANGTDSADLAEAMAVVKERQADTITEATPEQAEQRMADGLAACYAEGITDADLGLARRFVVDLETVAPGTLYSLERSGAGNDMRLIRKAIAEAKRRGYR